MPRSGLFFFWKSLLYSEGDTPLQKEMEYAQQYFQEHYNEDIQIKDYAKSRSMSVSWFLRNFKKFIGQPPAQYLLTIRMNNAVSLLETPAQ